MRFALYTIRWSPHQSPLANAMVKKLGDDQYRYVAREPMTEMRRGVGWPDDPNADWFLGEWGKEDVARQALRGTSVLMSGIKDVRLFCEREGMGKLTIYTSERWFKPRIGIFRLFLPRYFWAAWQFVDLLRNGNKMYYFPMGIHAARDMARLCGLFAGDFRCLFRAPKLDFEKKAGGRIWVEKEPRDVKNARRYCLGKMRMWGYYVESSKFDALPVQEASKSKLGKVKVLWVGRLLNWKGVDTIVRAVGEHANLRRIDSSLPTITLNVYGVGPEEDRLKKMAASYNDIIKFYPPVPIAEVRRLMREHDVYVLASNDYEGWGAVVCEALEEGMKVIGTYEAGSSATVLPESRLFHSGDWRKLRKLLVASANESCGNQELKGWRIMDGVDSLLQFIKVAGG